MSTWTVHLLVLASAHFPQTSGLLEEILNHGPHMSLLSCPSAGPGLSRPPTIFMMSLWSCMALHKLKLHSLAVFPGHFGPGKGVQGSSCWGPPFIFSRRSWKVSVCANLSDFKCEKSIHFGKVSPQGQQNTSVTQFCPKGHHFAASVLKA